MAIAGLMGSYRAAAEPVQPPTRLTLRDCISLALAKAPEARITQQLVLAAGLRARNAGVAFVPTLGLESGLVRGSQMGRDITGAIGSRAQAGHLVRLVIDQHLFDSGLSRAERQAARADLVAELCDQRATAEDLALRVVERFYDAVQAGEELGQARRAATRADGYVALASARFETGRVAKVDITRAQVGAAESQLQLLRAEHRLEAARLQLWEALGEDPGAQVELVDDVTTLAGETEASLVAIAASSHPRIETLQAELQARAARVRQARLAETMQLSVDGGYSLDTLSSEVKARDWLLYASVSYPLFDAGQAHRNTAALKAEMAALRLRLEDQSAVLATERKQAVLLCQEADMLVALAGKQVAQAEESVWLLKLSYEVGRTPLGDLLDAELALAKSEANLAATRFERKTAVARAYYASGVLVQRLSQNTVLQAAAQTGAR